MHFIDKTKPPPANVWLLVRASRCGEYNHFCVKSNSYWYNTRRMDGPAKWDSGNAVAMKIANTAEFIIVGRYSFSPFVPGEECRTLHIADAEWAENNINEEESSPLPKGFWERNPPFSDRRKDETY